MSQDEFQGDGTQADAQGETGAALSEDQTIDSQLAEAQKKAQGFMEGWQRERAEFANYKRRVERDMKDIRQNAAIAVLTNLLPIIDDFERAMTNLPDDLTGHAWPEGVSLIQRKFMKLLEDQQVEIIDPVGQPFDPNRHEAVGTEASESVESGHVTVTLQKGYVWGDRVLRPALVKIAS
ncbi:MAG: nucleotide exchange factor GrpE [Anaerolineae bacterium]|nr:nucleotide exchange factor GrpE [Anaerolineae bacterium]